MAHWARIGYCNGTLVEADKLTLKQTEQCFYCRTDGCNARMLLISKLTDHAHFRSYRISDHKFDQCIIDSLSFDSSKYSENSFELDDAIKYIVGFEDSLNLHKNKRTSRRRKTSSGTVGGDQELPIRSLKELYAQCLDTGIRGTYAGIYINDILACRHNFDVYCNGFEGFKIVEVTYFRKVYNEPALLFNYPCYDRGINKVVKMNFKDPQIAWDYYNKFKGSNHREPMIIAGIWTQGNGIDSICECTFNKRNQIFILSKV